MVVSGCGCVGGCFVVVSGCFWWLVVVEWLFLVVSPSVSQSVGRFSHETRKHRLVQFSQSVGRFSQFLACLLAWLIGWLVVAWLVGSWLVGWLVDWLVGWLVGWLAGWC